MKKLQRNKIVKQDMFLALLISTIFCFGLWLESCKKSACFNRYEGVVLTNFTRWKTRLHFNVHLVFYKYLCILLCLFSFISFHFISEVIQFFFFNFIFIELKLKLLIIFVLFIYLFIFFDL